MTKRTYRELSDSDYTKFRRSLLAKKGSPRQIDFLEAAKSSADFVACLDREVGVIGQSEVALSEVPMTENEFGNPPSDTETRLYESWQSIGCRTASRTTFWANVTRRHIIEGRIEASYLATTPSMPSGAARIERALTAAGDHDKTIDDCVRTILRRLGGIPEARGKRTVYVDCPFGRAWWREWLVQEIAQGEVDIARKVRVVTAINLTYWEKIVDRIVSRNSTFGCQHIRAAFLATLAELVDRDAESELRKPHELIRGARRVAAHQANRELSVLEPKELREIMLAVLSPT